jgi:hypothetical protein
MLDLASVLPLGCAENNPLRRALRLDTTVDIFSRRGRRRESASPPLLTTQDECRGKRRQKAVKRRASCVKVVSHRSRLFVFDTVLTCFALDFKAWLVEVVFVPLVMIEVQCRLKARQDRRSSKRLGMQFCHDSAGGEGRPLRPLTRKIASDGRPKKFCAVLGSNTLFVQDSEFIAFPILQGGNNRCVTIH